MRPGDRLNHGVYDDIKSQLLTLALARGYFDGKFDKAEIVVDRDFNTAKIALSTRVHGPRASGATFLAQFATKTGINTQLITSTIGPIELWAFNTTAEDARIRNALYKEIGAGEARKILATLFPAGSAAKVVEERLSQVKVEGEIISKEKSNNVIDELVKEILDAYSKNR